MDCEVAIAHPLRLVDEVVSGLLCLLGVAPVPLAGFGQLISWRVGEGETRLLAREGHDPPAILPKQMPEKPFWPGDFLYNGFITFLRFADFLITGPRASSLAMTLKSIPDMMPHAQPC